MGEDESQEKEKEILERDQLLFELISDTYNAENSRLIDIDDKASKIVVFVGVLIGLLSSFGTLLLKDIPRTNEFYYYYLTIFILSLTILIGSIICGLLAYRMRKFKIVPNTNTMIKWGKENKDKIDIIRIISQERSKAVNENGEILKSKIKFIRLGYTLLIIGIIITLIFICFLLVTYIPIS